MRGSSGGAGQTRCGTSRPFFSDAITLLGTPKNVRAAMLIEMPTRAKGFVEKCCLFMLKVPPQADEGVIAQHSFADETLCVVFVTEVDFRPSHLPIQISARRQQVFVETKAALHQITQFPIDT